MLFKAFSFLIFSFTLLFFLLLSLSFFLFVTIKTNPKYARNIIQTSIAKIIDFSNIKVDSIRTTIRNEKIFVQVENFRTIKRGVKIYGDTLEISSSLDDILQGKMYNIKINNFIIDARMNNNNTEESQRYSISKLYHILPSLRVLIKNFTFHNNDTSAIQTQNTSLFLNYGKYILFIKTESATHDYNLKVILTSDILRLSFEDIPSSLFHKQTSEKYNFLKFKNLGGYIEYNAQELSEFKYHITFSNLKVEPNKYIPSEIEFDNITLDGYKTQDAFSIRIPESVMQNNGKISTEISLNNTTKDINVDIENIPLETIKQLVPFKFINGTKFETLTHYLTHSLNNGLIKKTTVKVHYPVEKKEDIAVFVDFEGVDMQYNELFAPIKNANGFVKVDCDNTEVFVKDAKLAESEIKNSSADIHNNIVDIQLHTNGTINSTVQAFFPLREIHLEKFASGNTQLDSKISIDTKCNDIFKCVFFKGKIQTQHLLTALNDDDKAYGVINFEKLRDSDIIDSSISFNNFYNSTFSVNTLNLHTDINLPNKKVFFYGEAVENNQTILSVNKVELDLNNDNIKINEIDVPLVKFGNNHFALLWKKNNFLLKGKSIDIPVLTEIFNKFKNDTNEDISQKDVIKKIFPENLSMNIDIEKAYLFNQITTPIVMQMNIVKDVMENLFIKSTLLYMNYFKPRTRSILQNDEIYIKIPNIPNLLNGTTKNISSAKNGSLFLQGMHKENTTIWNGLMQDLSTNIGGFSLQPKKVKITGILSDDHIIRYSNIKIQDNKHTIFFTGALNTNTLHTDTKIFYTPSTIEVLNEVPLLKDVFKVTTLGGSKNGLISFKISAQGSVFSPTIKFNKSSSVKSVWKFGVGVLLLPLLLL